jgi:hypothetical protein
LLAGLHDVPTFRFHSLLLCAPITPSPYMAYFQTIILLTQKRN